MPKIILMVMRKAVLNLLAAGPFLLLGLIGLNSRMDRTDWQFVEYGPTTSAKIYAYVGPIRAATYASQVSASEWEIEYIVDYWIDEAQDGRLTDILPASAQLDAVSGPYQEILDSKRTLAIAAQKVAKAMEHRGDINGAVRIHAKILELGEIAKYGEFTSYTSAAVEQSEALRNIARLAPRLDEAERQQLSRAVSALKWPQKSFSTVIGHITVAYQRDRTRAGDDPIPLVVLSGDELMASSQSRLEEQLEDWQRLSVSDPELISLFGKSRVAYLHDRQLKEAVMVALAALDPSYVN